MHKNINHLFYFITTLCNGRCKFCCNWRLIEADTEMQRLSLDEINRISKNIGRLKTISMTGGEPFLREDIIDICNIFYTNTKFKALSIPTNGLLAEKISSSVKKIVSFCSPSLIVIELPLDGVYNHYDEIRGTDGAFNRMKETFFELKSIKQKWKNLHIKFNITYSYYNKDYIKEILASAKSIFGEIDFSLGLVRGEPQCNVAKNVDIQEYFNILREVRKIRVNSDIRNLLFKTVREMTNAEFKNRLLNKRPSVKCLAAETFIVLSYNGEIYPCEPLSDISLGNIRDFDFNLSKLLSKDNPRICLLSTLDRRRCICDWSCGISRSLWDSKCFFVKTLCRLGRELI